MSFKKIFSFGLIFLLLVSLGFFFFKKEPVPKRTTTSLKNKKDQKRSMVLGTAHFVPTKKNKEYFNLKQHVEKQWALKDISALKAWEITKGTKNFVAAVVDTGIHKDHPCLKPNLWVNKKEIPGNKKDDDKNGYVDDIHGWNFVDNNNDIRDLQGHGTHIAGLIAATGKTPKTPDCQVIGVAPQVSIMTLKYYDSRNSNNNVRNTIKAIEYAVKNGAHIINYSGGGPGKNDAEKSAIAKAADKNIIFVAAFGNEGSKIEKHNKYYPASYDLPNIFAIQSKSKTEIISSSNWIRTDYRKSKVHQTAPGENIISTMPPRRYIQSQSTSSIQRTLARAIPLKHNNYGFMTGTSQATALATGAIALVKSRHPQWSMSQVIRQVDRTGFGQGTEKIRKKTNQGKKLDTYKALIMRDQGIDLSDKPGVSDLIMPATDEASTLKKLKDTRGKVDVYDPVEAENTQENPLEILDHINRSLSNKKK